MRNLFAPNSPLDVGVDVILNSHIDLLEAMINEPKVLVENVEKTEEDSELTYENMFYIEKRQLTSGRPSLLPLNICQIKHDSSVVRRRYKS